MKGIMKKIKRKLGNLRWLTDVTLYAIRECKNGTYGEWAKKHWVKSAICTWETDGKFLNAWRRRQIMNGGLPDVE